MSSMGEVEAEGRERHDEWAAQNRVRGTAPEVRMTTAALEKQKEAVAGVVGAISWPGILWVIIWLHSPGFGPLCPPVAMLEIDSNAWRSHTPAVTRTAPRPEARTRQS